MLYNVCTNHHCNRQTLYILLPLSADLAPTAGCQVWQGRGPGWSAASDAEQLLQWLLPSPRGECCALSNVLSCLCGVGRSEASYTGLCIYISLCFCRLLGLLCVYHHVSLYNVSIIMCLCIMCLSSCVSV